jgi:hypothetical protein
VQGQQRILEYIVAATTAGAHVVFMGDGEPVAWKYLTQLAIKEMLGDNGSWSSLVEQVVQVRACVRAGRWPGWACQRRGDGKALPPLLPRPPPPRPRPPWWALLADAPGPGPAAEGPPPRGAERIAAPSRRCDRAVEAEADSASEAVAAQVCLLGLSLPPK